MSVAAQTVRPASDPGVGEEYEPAEARVSVVIPAYNEEDGLGDVLDDLLAADLEAVTEIIVVNDASTDRTAEIAERDGVRVINHPTNRGYGAALKTGIREATNEFVLTMDADGQHRIEDVATLCAVVKEDNLPACVIGNRTRLMHSPMWRMPGKWLLKLMAQFLTQRTIPDLNSGLRMIRRSIALKYIRLCPQGFSFSTTITMALMSRGYGVRFLPIQVRPRVGKSMVSVRTGFQTILLIIRLATLFNPLRIFLPMSVLFAIGGVAWGVPYAIQGQGVTTAAMMLFMTGVIMFALGLICDQVAQLRLERYE